MVVAAMPDRSTCDRYRGFRPVAMISNACSALRQASVTSCPWSRRTTEKAVPQDPPPITVTRTGYSLLTKSIDTGTPSSSNRLRSSFSTQ